MLADGCQAAVHLTVDVRDLDVDFYRLTGHKLYGPTGIGVLYGKRALLKSMRPFNGGGEMIREVGRDVITYADPPARFEAGTPPIIEAVGLAAAIDYVSALGSRGRGRARKRSARLRHRAGEGAELGARRSAKRRTRAPSFRSKPTACTRTMSRPFWTAKAWRCAPAIIARNR